LVEARRHDDVARPQRFAAVNFDDVIAAPVVALDCDDARAIANRQLLREIFKMGYCFGMKPSGSSSLY